MSVQRWARAYRDENYHAAIDTNNGTEAQNKLFKYSFLPRKKYTATLSNTISIIVENFLPTRRQQYLLQNYQQSSMYRSYQSHIPPFLHNRPRSVIIHCLDRKTNSNKILPTHIHDIDTKVGIFEIEKTSGGKHTVEFGIASPDQMPSCTCKDWVRYHLPCKHFFSIFTNRLDWGWDKLPSSYLQSAYLSTDNQALENFFQPSAVESQIGDCPANTDPQITQQLQRPVRTMPHISYNNHKRIPPPPHTHTYMYQGLFQDLGIEGAIINTDCLKFRGAKRKNHCKGVTKF